MEPLISNKPNLDSLEIRTGLIVNLSMITLLLEDQVLAAKDMPYTEIAVWQSGKDWHRSSIKHNGISAAIMPGKPGVNRQLVIVGESGRFTELSGGTGTEGVIKNDCPMASVRLVHGSIMAVGIVGGVFRLSGKTAWDDLTDKRVGENLEAICGHPAGGYLVSGWKGLLAHYRDGNVQRIKTGTQVILTDILCSLDGEIIACGQKGTLLRGRIDSMALLKTSEISEDFWSVVKFKGELYIASTNALYKWVDDKNLELVKFRGDVVPTSFYHLNTYEDSLLLSVGKNDAVVYDGEKWTRIL